MDKIIELVEEKMETGMVKQLREKILNAKFEPVICIVTIQEPCIGALTEHILTITPVSQGDIDSIESIEYYLVDGSPIPFLSSDSLEIVAKRLETYQEVYDKWNEDIATLRAFYEEHKDEFTTNNEVFSHYSDWHKDVFGYRPRDYYDFRQKGIFNIG